MGEEIEESRIDKLASLVKDMLSGEESGHDWWHVYRVWRLAKRIAEEEGADLSLTQAIALAHDIDDWKFSDNFDRTKRLLKESGFNDEEIALIIDEIKRISFKGANVKSVPRTLEGKIVQDADRLDALGAIGIARCFATGAKLGRPIYDESKPVMHSSFEEYKSTKGSSINHFYEKLLLLKDRMNTETAKRIAEHRHRFMEEFLDEFFKEIEGKA